MILAASVLVCLLVVPAADGVADAGLPKTPPRPAEPAAPMDSKTVREASLSFDARAAALERELAFDARIASLERDITFHDAERASKDRERLLSMRSSLDAPGIAFFTAIGSVLTILMSLVFGIFKHAHDKATRVHETAMAAARFEHESKLAVEEHTLKWRSSFVEKALSPTAHSSEKQQWLRFIAETTPDNTLKEWATKESARVDEYVLLDVTAKRRFAEADLIAAQLRQRKKIDAEAKKRLQEEVAKIRGDAEELERRARALFPAGLRVLE